MQKRIKYIKEALLLSNTSRPVSSYYFIDRRLRVLKSVIRRILLQSITEKESDGRLLTIDKLMPYIPSKNL